MKRKGIRTRPVGDVFTYQGKKYEVKEGKACVGCDFFGERGKPCEAAIQVFGLCFHGMRYDNKDVIFKEVCGE